MTHSKIQEKQTNQTVVTREEKLRQPDVQKPAYSYQEVVDLVENARRFGSLPGVEVSGRMLEKLGHPAREIPFIHVAGTNGKGSVSAFLTQILMDAGLKVGTFTSPHLIDFEERIRVNQEMIPKDMVKLLGNQLLSMDFGVTGTMFDYCLMMALMYFERQKCDVMILETGLGGRLDSTNAVGTPEVSVITKIGLDHMAILGNSLTAIAGEKAGILKRDTTAVFSSQEKEAESVLKKRAEEVGCPYYLVGQEEIEQVKTFSMKLLGLHQKENASTAMYAASVFLSERGWNKQKLMPLMKLAVEKTTWDGRMEILSQDPFVMVDGAHNGHGVLALRDSLKDLFPEEKFHFIMGVMADKDYKDMVKEILPLALDFTTVSVDSKRTLSGEELAGFIRENGVAARAEADYDHYFERLLAKQLPEDYYQNKTIIFGSLYFVGDTKRKYCMTQKNLR